MLNPAHISSIMLPMADRGCRGSVLCGASVFSAERAIIRTDVLTIKQRPDTRIYLDNHLLLFLAVFAK